MQDQTVKVIIFRLKDEEYAIPVRDVKSIERMQPITRIPRTASFIKGVINLRGIITPIIDLRLRFEMDEIDHSDSSRMIIVTVGSVEAGLIVDAAYDVIDLEIEEIEPPIEVAGGIDREYLKGVVNLEKRLLILLDLDKVLNPENMDILNPVESGK